MLTERQAEWHERHLASLTSPAALTDPQGRVLTVNVALRQVVRGPVEGRFVLDLLDLQDSDIEAARLLWEAARSGDWPLRYLFPEPDGGWTCWEAGPTGDPETGPWLHLFARAGLSPDRLLTLYTAAFDHAPIGFALFDDQARYVYVNQKLAELNGLPISAHLGQTVGQLLPALPPDVARRLEDTIRTGQEVPPVEVIGKPRRLPDSSAPGWCSSTRCAAPTAVCWGPEASLRTSPTPSRPRQRWPIRPERCRRRPSC